MKKVILTNSFEETQKLGEEISKTVLHTKVVTLHGDLGAGKTTFVQGFARGLGITKKIISPTFIIMRTYQIPDHPTKKFFYHVDLYRIESVDIEGIGLNELIRDPENIVLIEWPEKIEDLLQEQRIDVFFTYLGDNKRSVEMHTHSSL